MYDHTRQYRCTIIRGKSQKEMDDFLPAYAKVIDEVCPCDASDFESLFNNAFIRNLSVSRKHLTITERKSLASCLGCTTSPMMEKFMNQKERKNSLKTMTSPLFSRIFATRCNSLMAHKRQALLSWKELQMGYVCAQMRSC